MRNNRDWCEVGLRLYREPVHLDRGRRGIASPPQGATITSMHNQPLTGAEQTCNSITGNGVTTSCQLYWRSALLFTLAVLVVMPVVLAAGSACCLRLLHQ